jgi:hypothetical protein
VRASEDAADLTGLRVLLTADLLVRAAELGGLQVLTMRTFTGEPARRAAVERAAVALGVHPPGLPAAELARAWPGGPADVHVADDDADQGRGGTLVRASAARLAPGTRPGGATLSTPGGDDPLAVRLALMSVPRHQPTELTAGLLADAARTLGEWRHHVAGWAQFPSGAIPAPVAATLRTAFDSLDIAAVLGLLSSLAADDTRPPGPRFEAFVYADRVLGLDLPREIGR